MSLFVSWQVSEDTEKKVPFSSMTNSVHRVLLWEVKQLLNMRGYPQLEEVADKMSEEVGLFN